MTTGFASKEHRPHSFVNKGILLLLITLAILEYNEFAIKEVEKDTQKKKKRTLEWQTVLYYQFYTYPHGSLCLGEAVHSLTTVITHIYVPPPCRKATRGIPAVHTATVQR